MLTIPVYEQIGDITIYADSDKDFVFYPVPNVPTLRFGRDGRPIFMFLKYREEADNVTEGEDRGGGYVQFDCEFKAPKADLDQVRSVLQDRVDKIYRQRDQNAPDVVLASPTYRSGTVELITFEAKEGGMVEHIAGAGSPSLIGSNIASFAMELSQRGSTLLWDAFQMDTLPIAVRYDLNFLARIPALEMHIWLHSRQLHTYWEKITREVDESVWGDDEVSYKRTVREYFSKFQVAGVDIVDWPAEFAGGADGEKFKKEMIEWGWDMLDDAFKDALGDRFQKATAIGGVGSFDNVTRDYVEQHVTDINVHFKRNSVILWNIVPQATLQGFLDTPGPTGIRPRKDDFFKEISLDDPFFRMLQVNSRCNADFENDPIFAVKLHIEYGDKVEEFVFENNTTRQTFREFIKPSLGNKYKYWTEITYKNRERTFRSPVTQSDETELILSFGALGYLKFDIIAGDFDEKFIDHAQVHIRYSDPANGVPMEESVVQLREDQEEAKYERIIWAPVNRPYEYKVVYFLLDGQQVTRDWTQSSQTPLIINDVFENRLVVKFLPSGSFEKMSRILVDVVYEDPAHDYTVQKSLSMTSPEDDLTWTVPMWDDAPDSFRYQTTVSYRDGHSEKSDWQEVQGSTTLNVGEVFADFLEIKMFTELIDFNNVRLARVSLAYTDPANDINEKDDFIFSAANADGQTWKLPIKDKNLKSYTYHVTYFMSDGTRREVADITTSDESIILDVPAA